jgi:hypothetical protein
VFKNRVLRRIFGTKRKNWWEAGEDCVMRTFVTCTHVARMGEMTNAYSILVRSPEKEEATWKT